MLVRCHCRNDDRADRGVSRRTTGIAARTAGAGRTGAFQPAAVRRGQAGGDPARQSLVLGHPGGKRRHDRMRNLSLSGRRRQPLDQSDESRQGWAVAHRAERASGCKPFSTSYAVESQRPHLAAGYRQQRRRRLSGRLQHGVRAQHRGTAVRDREAAVRPRIQRGRAERKTRRAAQYADRHQRRVQLPELLGRTRTKRVQRGGQLGRAQSGCARLPRKQQQRGARAGAVAGSGQSAIPSNQFEPGVTSRGPDPQPR